MHRKDNSMITTRGCLSSYRKGEDPSAKINAWLKDNPDARLLDVKFIPVYSGAYAAYVLMILELPDKDKQEE